MIMVDLNSDLGESFGAYTLGADGEVLPHITSANIACGFHAGDPLTMEQTVLSAAALGVAVGAHPGYPDLMGFGRRSMTCSAGEIKAYIQYQLGALMAFAAAHGVKVQHCKPHGALYNAAARNAELAKAIAQGIAEVDRDIILLGLAGSELVKAGQQIGLSTACEVFADRAYRADGSLMPRSQPDSVIQNPEEIVGRAIQMVTEGIVTAATGEKVAVEAHSICVHGDTPSAANLVQKIHSALEKAGVRVAPLVQALDKGERLCLR